MKIPLFLPLVAATNLYDCDVDDFYAGFDPDDYSTAAALKSALHDYIDGHDVIGYTSTTDCLRVLDSYQGSSSQVLGVYSLLAKTDYPDEWNKEHLWPRSRGISDSGPDNSDLFNLRPCDLNLNSARGNKHFDTCTVGSNGCVSPAGTSSEDAAAGTMEDSDVWAPPPASRGDAARAAFYMAVRYDGSESSTTDLELGECSSDSTCGTNVFGRLSTLLQWHADDPVTAANRQRVDTICNDYQGNRNPFVDFPELAERIFGDGGGGGGGGSTPTTAAPTPFPVAGGSDCVDSVPSGLVWSDTGEDAECDELPGYCGQDIVEEACPATCGTCSTTVTAKETATDGRTLALKGDSSSTETGFIVAISATVVVVAALVGLALRG